MGFEVLECRGCILNSVMMLVQGGGIVLWGAVFPDTLPGPVLATAMNMRSYVGDLMVWSYVDF